jgi:plastocyanin
MTRGFKMITFQGCAITVAAVAMGFVAYDAKAAPPPAAATVHISNFTFAQSSVAVTPGTTVTWVNDDDIPHTVVSKTQAFKSKVLDTGDKFSFTFAKPGQFGYFCSLHPHMTGTVTVKA